MIYLTLLQVLPGSSSRAAIAEMAAEMFCGREMGTGTTGVGIMLRSVSGTGMTLWLRKRNSYKSNY